MYCTDRRPWEVHNVYGYRPLTAEPRVQSQMTSCEFHGEPIGTEAEFLPSLFSFLPPSHSSEPVPYTSVAAP
jgi:hypothetical protein